MFLAETGSTIVLSVFLLFCRIGGCLMIIPGYGTSRIPTRIRLFIALGVTLALAPALLPGMQAALPDQRLGTVFELIVSETFVGLLIGLLGRCFLAALETLGTLVSMAIGLSNMPGAAVENIEALPPVANLLTLTATAMVFITNQHWEVLRGLADSYQTIPPGVGIDTLTALERFAQQLAEAFLLALRVVSPFVIYTVIINLAIGLVNKLTPQIPAYFVGLPFIIAGGLYLLFLVSSEAIALFLDGYFVWLQQG
ncbi:flagellar biosynthesis protein FliR [Roseibium hamelinense]|nr:flagellar biosynthesis protein FliR [Roseibium hamelinense]MTI45905.1 flagellar biosynthesis protein FliR [Roseibium hamelinense]